MNLSEFIQNEWVQYIGVFLGVAGVPLLMFLLFRPRKNPVPPPANEDATLSGTRLVMGDMTSALASQLPGQTDRDRRQILPLIRQTGNYRPSALLEFQAVRAAMVLVPLVATVATCLLVDVARIPVVLIVGAALALAGFSIPRVILGFRARARVQEIERGLPVFADLLAIALLAGQSLIGGMKRVADQLRGSFNGLADELDIVIRQGELLSLAPAFEQWAERSQVNEIRNLAVIITQSQKLGNDPSAVLMEFANNMRVTLRQRADAQAARTSFYALFPTILCMWVPALVLLVMPVYFQFVEQRKEVRKAFEEGNKELQAYQQQQRQRPPAESLPGQ
jgi:Flp pilus assembly protein TadB